MNPEPFTATQQNSAGPVDSARATFYIPQGALLRKCVLMLKTTAKFGLGQVVRHRVHPFRGVIFDVDPTFSNTDEWWESIPEENRPSKDQPFYHLLAENETTYYVAYVSEQNLVRDESGEPVDHPEVSEMFGPQDEGGRYAVEGPLH
jgi:heat shock protein HspQ